jgi:hypothetical protein
MSTLKKSPTNRKHSVAMTRESLSMLDLSQEKNHHWNNFTIDSYMKIKNNQGNCWEVPKSYQYIPFKEHNDNDNDNVNKASRTSFFPLELSNKDYFHKIIDFIGVEVHSQLSLFHRRFSNEDINDNDVDAEKASAYGAIHQLLTSILSGDKLIKQFRLSVTDIDILKVSCTELLSIYHKVIGNMNYNDVNPNVLYIAIHHGRQLLEQCSAISIRADNIPSQILIKQKKLKKNFETLNSIEQQINFHFEFKSQRMDTFGWVFDKDKVDFNDRALLSKLNNRSDISILKHNSTRQVDSPNASLPKPTINRKKQRNTTELLLDEAISLKSQFLKLLKPKRKCYILLYYRLVSLSVDLERIFVCSSQNPDLAELQRLKLILDTIEKTLNILNSDDILVDHHNCIFSSKLVIANLLKESKASKTVAQFDLVIKIENSIQEINYLKEELEDLISSTKNHLLTDKNMEYLANEGTKALTLDYLFCELKDNNNNTLTSLIIKGGITSVLQSMSDWPGFDIINFDFNIEKPIINPNSPLTFTPGKDNSLLKSTSTSIPNNNENSVLNPPPPPKLNPHPPPKQTIVQDNSHPESFASSILSSNENDKELYLETYSFSNISSPLSIRRSPSPSPSKHQIDSLAFSPPKSNKSDIKFYINIGKDLVERIKSLLETGEASHTLLINRLVGTSDNLIDIIDLYEYSCDIDERDRLLYLAKCIRDTINEDSDINNDLDTEIDENGDKYSKSLERLDDIHELCSQIDQVLKTLQFEAKKSKKFETKDYSSSNLIDNLIKEILILKPSLEKLIEPFAFIDTIQERFVNEGTYFITSNFIFSFRDEYEGHCLGSYIISSKCKAILGSIIYNWPDFTVLKGFLDSTSNHYINSEDIYQKKNLEDINFTNAKSLQELGFNCITLKTAGFSLTSIVSAGYNPRELQCLGVDMNMLFKVDDSLSKPEVVVNSRLHVDHLSKFYNALNGMKWCNITGWDKLSIYSSSTSSENILLGLTNSTASPKKNRKTENQNIIVLLSKLFGIKLDSNGFILKIIIPNNNLVGVLSNDIINKFTDLTQLNLSGNKLKGKIPSSIGACTNLTSLFLGNNMLGGEIPQEIGNLKSISVLQLDNNKLTGRIPTSLGSLTQLRRLSLENNLLDSQIPLKFSQLTALQELFLSNNKLSGEFPVLFFKLNNLTTLHLSNNSFKGLFPIELCTAIPNLTSLSLGGNEGLTVEIFKMQKLLPKCRIK